MTEDNYLESTSLDEMVSIYVYTLMEDKGENPEDGQAHMALKKQVIAAVNDAIIDALPVTEAGELNKLFEQGEATPDKMSEIVAKSGVNTEEITEKVLTEFRESYMKEGGEVNVENGAENVETQGKEEA